VGVDRRAWVRERVAGLLHDSHVPDPQEGDVDDRWEWAAPVLLDPGLRRFLNKWLKKHRESDELRSEGLRAHVEDLIAIRPEDMGRRPEGLTDLLTEVALGSPTILVARTTSATGTDDTARRRAGWVIADAFWRLFNRPTVIKLLQQLAPQGNGREDGAYWRLVLRYCRDGNLQAVLDESWHRIWEQHAWSETETREDIAAKCVEELAQVIEPTPSRVHARFLRVGEDGDISDDEIRVRTDFALRFGEIRSEERQVSQDAVRAAFNSPFRPFVLASTSVGQEGLDFHPWCHRLVHWNLPGNPVDLEQREGRVHRYKGHAVRRNVAAAYTAAALELWKPGSDPWADIFELAHAAAREAGESDLVPYWIAAGSTRVQRHVPMLPYTKEVEAFRLLKRQLAAYRVVFGPPRQEELVTLLDNASLDVELLREWAVDLAPKVENGNSIRIIGCE